MKIDKNNSFWTSYHTKILKTSRGSSSKLKPYNSVNVAIGRACLHEHFCACQLYIKKPSEDQNIDHLDHIYGAILCDSYYVFRGLARGKLMSQLLSPNSCPQTPVPKPMSPNSCPQTVSRNSCPQTPVPKLLSLSRPKYPSRVPKCPWSGSVTKLQVLL